MKFSILFIILGFLNFGIGLYTLIFYPISLESEIKHYKQLSESYKKIYEINERTIKTQQKTIDLYKGERE